MHRRFEFWTFPQEDVCESRTRKRSQFIAHPSIDLAVAQKPRNEDLQLLTGFNHKDESPIVTVSRPAWTERTVCEVSCFEPAPDEDKVIFRKGTGLEYAITIDEDGHFTCRSTDKFRKLGTNLKKSFFDEAALRFVSFLNKTFHSSVMSAISSMSLHIEMVLRMLLL